MMKALHVQKVQTSRSSDQPLSGIIALIVSNLLLIACVQVPTVPLNLSLSPDVTLITADIRGVRIGMSPRKLQEQIFHLGLEEPQSNRETLQDIIFRSDRGAPSLISHIMFSKGDGTISFLDDITLDVGFCYGQIDSIWIREQIPEKDLETSKERDMRMFPGIIEGVRKKEQVLYTGKYKPDQFSSADVSYIDRGYSDIRTNVHVIERSVSVREGVGCYYRTLERELR